jgi:hypothetical protein
MKVYTLRIDREATLDEIEKIDGVQVRVPDSMKKATAERMILGSVPNVKKYYYTIHCVSGLGVSGLE